MAWCPPLPSVTVWWFRVWRWCPSGPGLHNKTICFWGKKRIFTKIYHIYNREIAEKDKLVGHWKASYYSMTIAWKRYINKVRRKKADTKRNLCSDIANYAQRWKLMNRLWADGAGEGRGHMAQEAPQAGSVLSRWPGSHRNVHSVTQRRCYTSVMGDYTTLLTQSLNFLWSCHHFKFNFLKFLKSYTRLLGIWGHLAFSFCLILSFMFFHIKIG